MGCKVYKYHIYCLVLYGFDLQLCWMLHVWSFSWDCNFDDGWCAWKSYMWTRHHSSSADGPLSDHTNGGILFIVL